MKIALFTDGIYPYVIGGMQRHSFYLAKYLAREGVQVELYHFNESRYDPSLLEFFSPDERKNINPVLLDFPVQDIFPGHYIRASEKYSENVFLEYSKRNPVDFIYAKGFCAWKLLNEKIRNPGKFPPVGLNFHGYEMFQEVPDIRSRIQNIFLLKPAVRFNVQAADCLFSYGRGISNLLTEKLSVPPGKIIESPSGVERVFKTEEDLKINNPLKVLFVGRFERRKGILELTGAIKKSSGLKMIFELAGDIPEKLRLRQKNVIYHGKIDSPERMNEIYRDCDILICPSYAEGMPNVILEAMSNGLAIITTGVGAVRAMVDDKNGWIINRPDVNEIVDALIKAESEPPDNLLNKKKESLMKITDRFLWPGIVKNLIAKIENIVRIGS